MTKEVHISNLETADDTELRSFSLRMGSKNLRTPITTITTKDFYKDTNFPSSYCQLNEIDIMTRTSYAFSDITPIPSIPKTTRMLSIYNFDEFKQYLHNCVESIEKRNKKSILGYLPATAPEFMRQIVDFYLDNGINAFYIDFDGTMITSHLSPITAIKILLNERGYEENHFIYYVNMSYGKAINDENVISARDLLGFGYGLDSMGGIHAGPRRSEEFYIWLKQNKDIISNAKRILDISKYGYYKSDSKGIEITKLFPENPVIGYSNYIQGTKSKQERIINIVNLQNKCIESTNLVQVVREEKNKTLDYFSSKKDIMDVDIDLLKNTKEKIK